MRVTRFLPCLVAVLVLGCGGGGGGGGDVDAGFDAGGGTVDAGGDAATADGGGMGGGDGGEPDGGGGAEPRPLLALTAGEPGVTAPRRLYVLVENADGSLGVLERTTSLPEMIRIEDMVHDPVTNDVFVNVTRAFPADGVYRVPAVSGEPERLSGDDNVQDFTGLSPDGSRIAYAANAPSPAYAKFVVSELDGTGRTEFGMDLEQVQAGSLLLSHDGARALFRATDPSDGESYLFRTEVDGTGRTTVGGSSYTRNHHAWAPMMDAFVYGENDTLTSELYVAAGDGSGTAVAITSGTWSGGLWQWLPDASGIAYTAGLGLHVAAADGSGSTTLSNTENGNVEGFVISPDGSLAVYKTPLGLYEATTDGVGDPVLVTDDPSTRPVPEMVQFSSHLEVPAYAYWKSSELDFRVVEELPYEFVVAAVEVFRMMVLRNISAILYETDMDGDGARELQLREIPAGGLTELDPPTLLNDGGQNVGEVTEIPGGVAFTHVPPPDAGLYEVWVQLFGAETAEMVFEMARIGLLQGLQ